MKNYFLAKAVLIILFLASIDATAQNASKNKLAITVNDKFKNIAMTVQEFKSATVSCKVFESKFNDHILLSGFKIKYPGQKSIEVQGNKLNDEAIKGLDQLRKGDQIILYDAFSQHQNFKTNIDVPITVTITDI